MYGHSCMHIGIGAANVTTSSLTATSVTISWSPQPAQFRLPVVEYTVSLTRVTGSGQALCPHVIDSRSAVTTTDTSMSFTGLEEFSTYTVTVTTTFNVFGSNMTEVADDMMFTTPSAGMYNCHNYRGVETAAEKLGGGGGQTLPHHKAFLERGEKACMGPKLTTMPYTHTIYLYGWGLSKVGGGGGQYKVEGYRPPPPPPPPIILCLHHCYSKC